MWLYVVHAYALCVQADSLSTPRAGSPGAGGHRGRCCAEEETSISRLSPRSGQRLMVRIKMRVCAHGQGPARAQPCTRARDRPCTWGESVNFSNRLLLCNLGSDRRDLSVLLAGSPRSCESRVAVAPSDPQWAAHCPPASGSPCLGAPQGGSDSAGPAQPRPRLSELMRSAGGIQRAAPDGLPGPTHRAQRRMEGLRRPQVWDGQ